MTASSTSREYRGYRYNPRPLLAIVAIILLVASIAGGVVYRLGVQQPYEDRISQTNALSLGMIGLSRPIVNKLDPRFGTANADLVADAPTDPSKLIDPTPLTFSYLSTDHPEVYRDAFRECCDAVSKQIGRPVEYVMFNHTEDELRALRDGKVQVAAFGTGSVPIAVDAAGFVPFCCLGGAVDPSGERGGDYKVMILVRADSTIQSLDDLKGHELGLTQPDSNSGFKAPLVLLSRDHGLMPVKDFTVRYSGSQEASIALLAKGTFEVVAVASDVLQRALANKEIAKDQFRVLYTSEPFPPACFGYAYNLNPKTAAEVKDALLSFDWQGTGLVKVFQGTGQDRFLPVNYKNDWALVRRIDDAIGAAHIIK